VAAWFFEFSGQLAVAAEFPRRVGAGAAPIFFLLSNQLAVAAEFPRRVGAGGFVKSYTVSMTS
jgi:hypothetical protein